MLLGVVIFGAKLGGFQYMRTSDVLTRLPCPG